VPGPVNAKIKQLRPIAPTELNMDLRDLPQMEPEREGEEEMEPVRLPPPVKEKRPLPGVVEPPPAPEASIPTPEVMPATSVQFDGLNFALNGAGWPPDTVGDVGPNHYIQGVNTSWGIYNKTGTKLAGNTFNALWATAATGTLCDTSHRGDPTVVFDPIGGRWFLADFAFTGTGTTPPFFECIAVSKTTDPVAGGWWFYAIRTDDATHPWFADYPKMGIWPDGLYMAANMFNSASVFQAARVWAFNRTDMEAGLPVQSVVVDLGSTAYFSLLPSNFRGPAPPAGRENFFLCESQTLFAYHVFKFHVVYGGPGSTFTGPTNVSQTSYNAPTATVPTPANALDTVQGDFVKMQLQYRTIAGVESLWVNHTVRTTAAGPNGLQWAQINVTGGTVATTPVQQQIYGNLAADGVHRWLGSLAVDRTGNMAIGYSAASATTNTSIRYSGRLATDPVNTLAQGEATMAGGSFNQTGNCAGSPCQRWGDYAAMSVDPIDNCTFWFTTEYYGANGTNWLTRIGAFKFPSCVPTAAPVVLSGRVTNPDGSPLPNAIVRLQTDTNQLETTTNGKGNYVFESIGAGSFCVITATKKGYSFFPENVSFSAFSNVESNFTGTRVPRGSSLPGRPGPKLP
jgi:hypothetical protein